jgi:Tfp pilus assembly protein FimT
VGGIVAATIAIVAVVIVLAVPRGTQPSDEQQIRAVVAGMQEAWNRTDFGAYRGYLCKDNQRFWAELGVDDAGATTMRERGRAEFTVHSVNVSGARAQASVKEKYSNGDEPPESTEHFVLEEGKWKFCETKLMNEPTSQRLRHT